MRHLSVGQSGLCVFSASLYLSKYIYWKSIFGGQINYFNCVSDLGHCGQTKIYFMDLKAGTILSQGRENIFVDKGHHNAGISVFKNLQNQYIFKKLKCLS